MDHTSASTPTYDLLKWFLAPRLGLGADLTTMRECAEALRDSPGLLRSALQVLRSDERALQAVARRSAVHPNGFAKVVLSRGVGWSLRLHVWSPWIQMANNDVNPHGHRWAFASWIITGTLRETMFDEVETGPQFGRFAYDGHPGTTGRVHLRAAGTASLAPVGHVDREAGTVYERTGSEVHTAAPRSDLVATLVLQGQHATDTTEVFLRPGEPEVRSEPVLSVDDLKLLITEVLAELP